MADSTMNMNMVEDASKSIHAARMTSPHHGSTSRYLFGIHPSVFHSDALTDSRYRLSADGSIANGRYSSWANAQANEANKTNGTPYTSIVGDNIAYDEMGRFNRYGWLYPDDEVGPTNGLVFMTRPDLNIFQTGMGTGDPIGNMTYQCLANELFTYVAMTDPVILLGLTQSGGGGYYKHHFITFLTDRVEEYQIPDFSIKVNEISQPFTNFKVNYAGNANDSLSGSEFQITFRETSNFRILKFFQTWVEYMNNLARGVFNPKDEYRRSSLEVGAQIMDYCSSVYFIRVKPDNEIVYFHKQTGAFPKGVPHNVQSYNRGSNIDNKITIEFAGGFPEPLTPVTLGEFNYNSQVFDMSEVENNVAKDYGMGQGINAFEDPDYTGSTWGPPLVKRPVILQVGPGSSGNGACKYYLQWLRN